MRLRIELETVQPFVALRHVRYGSLTDLVEAMNSIVETRALDGVRVDYLDGVVFSADECYLCVGQQTTLPGPVSDYTGQDIYYRSIQHGSGIKHDRLTIHDYLWRWDTDWFWCSRAFGAQNPRLRRWWPPRYRRSSFYWKLLEYDRRFNIADGIEKRHGRPPRERVVQDVEVPIERCAEFLDWFLSSVPIEPIWLCPLRLRDRWPLYPMPPGHTYVNVGFWSSVPVGVIEGETNRLIERKVRELDGHKSLYSDAFYSQAEFDELYGGEDYRTVEEGVRSRLSFPRPLCEGGARTVTASKERVTTSPTTPGRLSLAQILEILVARSASAAVHRLRRQCDRARRRPGFRPADPPRHHLSGHRTGRARAGPRLRVRGSSTPRCAPG